ncbi:MAG: hypothetical protein HQL20_10030 [Candidatus Omnitrophica bacterium]|nr:hypothetical protein [Candidatus Omnitrophota bacterium]
MIASIRTLRTSTREILGAVSRGDTVSISNRGRTCAKIVPVGPERPQAVSLAGLWKDHQKTSDVHKFIGKLRSARHAC